MVGMLTCQDCEVIRNLKPKPQQCYPAVQSGLGRCQAFPVFCGLVHVSTMILEKNRSGCESGIEECLANTRMNPRCSMYGIFTYIWLEFMVNVGKYSIHGAYWNTK